MDPRGNPLPWVPKDLPGETRITGTVWVGAKEAEDGSLLTTFVPSKSTFPYLLGQLNGIYNITTIQMVARVVTSGYPSGLNQKFDIYTREKYMNLCGRITLDHWKLCKKDAILKAEGETEQFKCNSDAKRAQYILIARGSPDSTEIIVGQPVTEIGVWGNRVGDGNITPEPAWGKPDRYLTVRTAVAQNVNELWYEASWVELEKSDQLEDVVFGWGHNKIMAMAVTRGSGRAVIILGEKWMNELFSAPYLANFHVNLKSWLGEGEKSQFRYANESYSRGDIVLVKRSHQFDADKLAKSVMAGDNGVVISFLGQNGELVKDSTVKLLEKLNVTVKSNKDRYSKPSRINPSSTINSNMYVPQEKILRWAANDNFGTLCTRGPFFSTLTLLNKDMQLITSPGYQDALKAVLQKYRDYFDDRAPCGSHPYTWEPRTRDCWKHYNMFAMSQMTKTPIPLFATDIFPGATARTEKKTSYGFRSRPPKVGFYFPTGAYVNPGEVFSWKVHEHSDKLDKYFFTFSCQRDQLVNKKPWRRWPLIQHGLQLQSEGSYATPVGGILLMRVDAPNMSITMQLNDVYRHPLFDLRNKSSIDDWNNERLRYNGAPWTIFVGDKVFACLQTKAIVKLMKDDLEFVSTYLDNVVKLMHNFRGSVWENAGIEVFAVDIQISAGDGHSGMPIYGHLPWQDTATSLANIKGRSAIGLTHEFGHNLQNGAVTLKWGGEVTNNVYHFPVRGHLVNLTAYGFNVSWAFQWGDMQQVLKVWREDQYVGVNLGYYNWLGMIFGEGLLVNLWHEGWNNRNSLNSEEKKVNFWLKKFCAETEHNVLPWQELWHFPINNETRTECAKYRCFFPDDALTQMAPDVVEKAISKVKDGCDRKPKKQVTSKHDIMRGLYTKGEPWFSFL
ncbi:unnamed protein product [Echinostoma caproni]|uniref:Peptidase M60 domain-containing protein n=1 Tax=Echinostoma caproni TaxID=27848 RepID=A0A183AKX3_9TREM|nr:unnamed protein product [Echinostoma caproni]